MRDAVELERRGVPTITLAHERFEKAAKAQAYALGLPSLPFLIEPTPKQGILPSVEEAWKTAEKNIDLVISTLTQPKPIPVL